MNLDLDAIEARAEAAQAGPWEYAGSGIVNGQKAVSWGYPKFVADTWEGSDRNPKSDANGEFIAHAREDVPALVAEVRELRAAAQQYIEGANGAAL